MYRYNSGLTFTEKRKKESAKFILFVHNIIVIYVHAQCT